MNVFAELRMAPPEERETPLMPPTPAPAHHEAGPRGPCRMTPTPGSSYAPTVARRWRLPALLLSPTVILTATAKLHPVVFVALRRDPDALARGQLWRLLSPVLVQADVLQPNGVWRTLAVLILVAAVLAIGARWVGTSPVVVLYVIGALVGHAVGHWWQPFGSGCSVAASGVLGGMAAWLLRAEPLQVRAGAALVLVAAVGGVLLEDIHGPPVLAGALVGGWMLREKPSPAGLGKRGRQRSS